MSVATITTTNTTTYENYMATKKRKKLYEKFKEMKYESIDTLKSRLRPGALDYKQLPSLVSDYFDTSKLHDPFMDQVRHKKED
jgi:hypothetical protein